MLENSIQWLQTKFVPLVLPATWQTIEMVLLSTIFSVIFLTLLASTIAIKSK